MPPDAWGNGGRRPCKSQTPQDRPSEALRDANLGRQILEAALRSSSEALERVCGQLTRPSSPKVFGGAPWLPLVPYQASVLLQGRAVTGKTGAQPSHCPHQHRDPQKPREAFGSLSTPAPLTPSPLIELHSWEPSADSAVGWEGAGPINHSQVSEPSGATRATLRTQG